MPAVVDRSRGVRGGSVADLNLNDSASVANFVGAKWQSRSTRRGELEAQWYNDILQYLGYQYSTYSRAAGTVVYPPAPKWRVRMVCNLLMPAVRKFVAKMLRQRPIWTCNPATNEIEDLLVSNVSTKLSRIYWKTLGMDQILTDLYTWLAVTGNAFLRIYWDPEKNLQLQLSENDVMGLSPDLQQFVAKKPVFIGDPTAELATCFEIDVDPNATSFHEAAYFIRTKVRGVQFMRDRYGKAKGLEPDGKSEASLTRWYERKLQQIAGPTGNPLLQDNIESEDEGLTVHEFYWNPCAKYPRGLCHIVAGGKVLDRQEDPNDVAHSGYVHLREIPAPGRIWGESSLHQAIGQQADVNKARSQLVEYRNLCTKPKVLLPKGCQIPDTEFTSEPGEKLWYVPTLKPEYLHPPPLDTNAYRMSLDYSQRSIEDITSVHEVTKATMPSGARTGVALQILQEMDDQTLAPVFLNAENALSTIGSILLQLLAKNVTEERLVRMVGNDKQIEVLTFTGQSLYGPNKDKPGINYFDVVTQMGSQFPDSKSAKQALLLDLWTQRILVSESDRKRVLEALGLGQEEIVIDSDMYDRQNADRENLQMAQGMTMEVQPYDNPIVHLERHTLFEKQPQFAQLTQMDPGALQRFESHKRIHEMSMGMGMGMGKPPAMQPPGGTASPLGPTMPMAMPEAPGVEAQPEAAPVPIGEGI